MIVLKTRSGLYVCLVVITTVKLIRTIRNGPSIRFFHYGFPTTGHPHITASRRAVTAAVAIPWERPYHPDADRSYANLTLEPVGAASVLTLCLQNSYSFECIGQNRRASELSCLQAAEHDKNCQRSQKLQPVSLITPSWGLCSCLRLH